MKKILVVAIMGVLLSPASVWAVGGSSVKGCATNTLPLATPRGVSDAASDAADTVTDEVEDMAEALRTGQNQIISTIESSFETQNTVLHQLLVNLEKERQKIRNQRIFGSRSDSYMPVSEDEKQEDVLAGLRMEENMASVYRDRIDKYIQDFDKRKQRLQFYGLEDLDEIDSDFFFPEGGTLSVEDGQKVLFALRSIIDPFPTPNLPEELEGGAEEYEALKKAKNSRLAMPTSVLSEIAASYMPTIEAQEWKDDMYATMGGSGTPSEVEGERISPMTYLDMMVASRFANQDWLTGEEGIHGKTPTGVLREIAVMDSVKMEMQRRQMRYLQQTAGLLAQEQAARTDEQFGEKLQNIYRKVVQ